MSKALIRTRVAGKYKPTKIDRDRVKNLTLLGLPETTIASYIGETGIDVTTLRVHFRYELTKYRDEMLGKIAHSLYKQALDEEDGGSIDIPIDVRQRAKFFVMKTRAGWRENDTTVINANQVMVVKRVIGIDEKDL
jgi:hypothetical protein